jgi:hypothetical protein
MRVNNLFWGSVRLGPTVGLVDDFVGTGDSNNEIDDMVLVNQFLRSSEGIW